MNCRKVSKSFNQVLNKPKLWLRQLKLEQLEGEDFYRIWNDLAQKLDGSDVVEKDFVMILIKTVNTKFRYPLDVGSNIIYRPSTWTVLFLAKYFFGKVGLKSPIVIAKFLLEHADPNRTISSVYGLEGIQDHVSALHIASNYGYIDLVTKIKSKYKNPMIRTDGGYTSLHLAALNGHLDVVKYLVGNAKTTPLVKNKEGNTPIHLASKNCHVEVVRFLVNTCDKADVRNNKNETPVDLARESGNRRIVKFLDGVKKSNLSQID